MTELVTFKVYNNQGEEISFADYVNEFAGPSIYHKDFKAILDCWKQADWVYTDEYIAPIASQVLTDACELDHEMFSKIMNVIVEAFEKFKPEINPNHLTRIK